MSKDKNYFFRIICRLVMSNGLPENNYLNVVYLYNMKMFIKKIINSSNVLIVTYTTALLSPLVIMALLMRPIADDYAYFSDPHIGNPFEFAMYSYLEQTGRALQAFWTSALYVVFNDKAVIFGAIIQLILLTVVCVLCCYALFYRKKTSSNLGLIAMGMLVATTSLLVAPSLVDTYLWLTSSTVYVASLIALFSSLAIAALTVRNKSCRAIKWYVLLFVIVFSSQLFSEPTSMIMVYLSALAIAISLLIYKNKYLLKTSIICLSGSVLGFLAVYLSPGSHGRQINSGSHFNLHDMFISSFIDISKMSYLFTSHRIVIIAILALFITLFVSKKLSKRTTLYIVGISLLSAFLISYCLFIVARYSMGSYMPYRAFSATSAIVSIFIAIAVGVSISYLIKNTKKTTARLYITLAMIPLIVISIMLSYKSYLPIIRAVTIRSSMYDVRDLSIKNQLLSNPSVVNITPVPILVEASDAIDFQYTEKQIDWFEFSFKRYYSIPNDTKVKYNNQPSAYCVNGNNPIWTGAKYCTAFN